MAAKTITNATVVKLEDSQSPGAIWVRLNVIYDNTGPAQLLSFEIPNTPTAKADLEARIKALDTREADATAAKTALAVGTVLDLSVKAAPGPTAKETFNIALAALRRLRQAATDGVPKAAVDADTLAAQLNTAYVRNYFD